MSRVRECNRAMLRTGASKCPIDLKRVAFALVVARGVMLPSVLTADAFAEMCHADQPGRVCPIGPFVDYAREGGEVQTSNVGYGPVMPNGVSARRDTFTLGQADYGLNASLLQNMSSPKDVYFVDTNNVIYGVDDGNGGLAGIPMSSVFPDLAVFDGAEKNPMTVSFCYEDAQKTFENFQSMNMDFDISLSAQGLTAVVLHEVSSGKFKIIEKYGGLDRTEEFGAAVQKGGESAVLNGSAVTYENGLISITASGTVPALAKPSVLYKADIKGIEYVGTEMLSV